MAHWIYPANVKYYDVLRAFRMPEVYWPINSLVSTDDSIFVYLSSPYKQIGFVTKAVKLNIDRLSVSEQTKPFLKSNETLTKNNKAFMQLKVVSRIELGAESDLSYERLRLNGLNGSLMGPRKLENNPELLAYISQKTE